MPKGVLSTLRTPSPLSVDVSELLRHPGATKRLSFTSEVAGLAVPMARVEAGGLRFDLRLDALVDGIHVTGSIAGDVTLECRRCARSFRTPAEVAVDEVFLYPDEEGEEDPDTYRIEDETIDLEALARDDVLLSLPLNPLCREDCAGLCTVCGADRNEGDCGHRTERIDARWGPLHGLREQMEE